MTDRKAAAGMAPVARGEVVPFAAARMPGPDARPRKSRPAAISPGASAAVLLSANLMRAAEDLSWNRSLALSGFDPESIHQLRVALRRVRAILSLAREFVPKERIAHLRDLARATNRALGPARESDVLMADMIAPVREAVPNDPDLARLSEQAAAARERRWNAAREALQAPGFAHLLDGLRGLARELRACEAATSTPAVAFARKALTRRHKKLRKAGKHFQRMSAAERHRLRIAAKKQRYVAEVCAGLFPGKRGRRYARALARVQKALGAMNDAAVMAGELEGLVEAGGNDPRLAHGAGIVLGFHGAGAKSRDRALTKAWRRLKSTRRFWRKG